MEINEDHVQIISQIVLRLNRDEGSVIPLDQIVAEASEEGITKAEVKLALNALVNDGEVSWLDKDTIEFNN